MASYPGHVSLLPHDLDMRLLNVQITLPPSFLPDGTMFTFFSSTARPTIVSLPAPDTITEGMRFELLCMFTGVPAPNILWQKDDHVFLLGEVGRAGESSTVLEGQCWRSTAYWSVMQESTTVRCLMLLGMQQGVCDWK